MRRGGGLRGPGCGRPLLRGRLPCGRPLLHRALGTNTTITTTTTTPTPTTVTIDSTITITIKAPPLRPASLSASPPRLPPTPPRGSRLRGGGCRRRTILYYVMIGYNLL